MSTPIELALPEPVSRHQITTARCRHAALIAPAQTAGAPVVLFLPGWTGSKEDFTPTLAELSRRGFTAVAIDQRGQYETVLDPAAASEREAYAFEELVADVLAVVRQLTGGGGGPVHLVGHSFGGLVATRAVIADPGSFASLILLCSGPGALPGAQPQQLLHQLVAALAAMPIEQVWQIKHGLDAKAPGYAEPPRDIANFLATRFTSNAPAGLAQISYLLATAQDLTADLAHTGVPVAVIYGEFDDAWPLQLQQTMARRLGSVPAIIAGAGHSPAISHPAHTADLIADHAGGHLASNGGHGST